MWDSDEHLNDFDRFLLETNLVGATSLDELRHRERLLTLKRTQTLKTTHIKRDFSYKHLKAIHKHIFQDVYTWAGQDRYEMGLYGFMSKGDSTFCKGSFLPKQSKSIFENLKQCSSHEKQRDVDTPAQNLTTFMADLNALHPFREGNGRVQRIFINELAHNAGFALDLNLIPKNDMIEASIQAMQGDNTELLKLIKTNLYSNTQAKLQRRLDINLNNYGKVSDEKQKQEFLERANAIKEQTKKFNITLDSKSLQKLERINQAQSKERSRGK